VLISAKLRAAIQQNLAQRAEITGRGGVKGFDTQMLLEVVITEERTV
jgi:hypothetical protein